MGKQEHNEKSELDYLANTCANIIRAQGLDDSEYALVGAKIIGALIGGLPNRKPTDGMPNETAHTDSPTPQEENAVTAPAEPLKREEREPKLLAPAGESCTCVNCGKVVYKQVADIMDPMSTLDFIGAFEPVDHDVWLSEDTRYQNIEGNMSVDCPLCKSNLAVYLIGSGQKGDSVPSDIVV